MGLLAAVKLRQSVNVLTYSHLIRMQQYGGLVPCFHSGVSCCWLRTAVLGVRRSHLPAIDWL